MRWLVGILVVAGVGVACLLLVGAFGQWGDEITTTTVTGSQLAECATAMHVTFPPSTEPIGFHKQEWQDTYILLKARMDRKDLDAFIASSPFAGKTMRSDQIRVYGKDDLAWWATCHELGQFEWKEGQQEFLSEYTDLPGADGLRILIDLRDLETVVVYLEFVEM